MRQPPSPAVEPKNVTVLRISSTAICLCNTPLSLSVRSIMRRSGWAWAAILRATGCLASRKATSPLQPRAPPDWMRQHEARHAVSQRRLADALRSGDQKRMRHAAGTISGEQASLGVLLTKQHGGRPRRRRFVDLVFVGRARAHDAPTSLRRRSPWTGKVMGLSRAPTAFQIFRATTSFGSPATMTTQRPGSAAAMAR